MKPYLFALLALAVLTSCKAFYSVGYLVKLDKARPPSAAFSVSISFTLLHGLVVIPVMIDGKEYHFIVDTGAPITLVTPEVANALRPGKNYEKYDLGGYGNTAAGMYIMTARRFNLGGVEFTNVPCAVDGLSTISRALCTKIDGMIGASLMQRAMWSFDFEKKICRISNDLSSQPVYAHADTIPISFSKVNRSPNLSITYDTVTTPSVYTLDMGSAGSFSTGKTVLYKNFPSFGYDAYRVGSSSIRFRGLEELDSSFIALHKTIQVGATSFEDQNMVFGRNHASIIGMSVWKHFNFTLDWKGKRLMLEARDSLPPASLESMGFNFNFLDSVVRVTELTYPSHAASSGLQMGDTILAINEVDCENLSDAMRCNLFKELAAIKPPYKVRVRQKGRVDTLLFDATILTSNNYTKSLKPLAEPRTKR